jgi:hypothetical protein
LIAPYRSIKDREGQKAKKPLDLSISQQEKKRKEHLIMLNGLEMMMDAVAVKLLCVCVSKQKVRSRRWKVDKRKVNKIET